VKAGRSADGGAEFTIRLPGSTEPLDSPSETTTSSLPAVAE